MSNVALLQRTNYDSLKTLKFFNTDNKVDRKVKIKLRFMVQQEHKSEHKKFSGDIVNLRFNVMTLFHARESLLNGQQEV